jgi:hypothetical protein
VQVTRAMPAVDNLQGTEPMGFLAVARGRTNGGLTVIVLEAE